MNRTGNLKSSQNQVIINSFKNKTDVYFRQIGGLDAHDIEQLVYEYVEAVIVENDIDASINGIAVTGSRSRGMEHSGSDIDVVIEYFGNVREDTLFNLLNSGNFNIEGIPVDINPVTADKTGTLEEYLLKAEAYMENKQIISPRERQEQEIETIKERNVVLKLSDADCDRLAIKAGIAGISISGLLESFIGDLVSGAYSNGSDEEYLAMQWFDRCGYGRYNSSLLYNLICKSYDIDTFLDVCEDIKQCEEDIIKSKEHPEDYDPEEITYLEDDLEYYQDEFNDFTEDYRSNHEDADMDKEIDVCRKWLDDLTALKEPKISKVKRSAFEIVMCNEHKYIENTSGMNIHDLCKAYAFCEKPFIEMDVYGKWIDEAKFAAIQQGEPEFTVEFNHDKNEVIIFDGKNFIHKNLQEYMEALKITDISKENSDSKTNINDLLANRKNSRSGIFADVSEALSDIPTKDLAQYYISEISEYRLRDFLEEEICKSEIVKEKTGRAGASCNKIKEFPGR